VACARIRGVWYVIMPHHDALEGEAAQGWSGPGFYAVTTPSGGARKARGLLCQCAWGCAERLVCARGNKGSFCALNPLASPRYLQNRLVTFQSHLTSLPSWLPPSKPPCFALEEDMAIGAMAWSDSSGSQRRQQSQRRKTSLRLVLQRQRWHRTMHAALVHDWSSPTRLAAGVQSLRLTLVRSTASPPRPAAAAQVWRERGKCAPSLRGGSSVGAVGGVCGRGGLSPEQAWLRWTQRRQRSQSEGHQW